jgi:hypothetical protein
MNRTCIITLFFGWMALVGAVSLTYGQYVLPQDTVRAAADTAKIKADTAAGEKEPSVEAPADQEAPKPSPTAAVDEAHRWLRRLLYRGRLDATHIGAYAQYQLSNWSEAAGPYGPVQALLTVYYLGSSEWMGRDAEWLQAVYRTMDAEPMIVEYDLLVPSATRIREVYRVLYRVDGGEIKTANFNAPLGQLDYDVADVPIAEGPEELKLYSGTYPTEKYRGSGSDGAEVVISQCDRILPLCLLRLGYGDQALAYTLGGSDATARFNVPPPPSTRH